MPKLFLSDPAMAIMIVQSLLQKGTSAPRDTTSSKHIVYGILQVPDDNTLFDERRKYMNICLPDHLCNNRNIDQL